MTKIIKKEKISYTYTVCKENTSYSFSNLDLAKRSIMCDRLSNFLKDTGILRDIDAETLAEEILENEKEIRYILDSVGVEVVE